MPIYQDASAGRRSIWVSFSWNAIEAAEPLSRGAITYEDKPLPFAAEIDNTALIELPGGLRITPLNEGVDKTIRIFKDALAEGRITAGDLN